MFEHHVLDVSKQHVLGTMHQSYNAESPKFVNESRRRESDTAATTNSGAAKTIPKLQELKEFAAIQGFAAIQFNQNINNWTLTIDNPPDGHLNTFTKKTDVASTLSMDAEEAEIWLEKTVQRGTMNTGIKNTIEKMYKSSDSESGEWIPYPRNYSKVGEAGSAFKIQWTQSAESRIIYYPSFEIVKEVVDHYFSLITFDKKLKKKGAPKKVFVDKEAEEYTKELNMGVLKLLIDLLPKNSEFKDKYCSDWQIQRTTYKWNHEDVVNDIKTTIEVFIAPNWNGASQGYEFLQRNTTV